MDGGSGRSVPEPAAPPAEPALAEPPAAAGSAPAAESSIPSRRGGFLARRRLSAATLIAAVIAGVLAGGLGANAILRQPPRYLSRAILLLDQPGAIVAASSQGPVEKLNALRSKYAVIAKTRRITAAVAQKTGFPEPAVANAINVFLPASLVLIVDARTGDPAQARTIANATSEELVALVKSEMDAARIPPEQRITMSVVAPAQPGAKYEPTRDRAVTTGTLAGILSFVGVVTIAESVRSYRRRR